MARIHQDLQKVEDAAELQAMLQRGEFPFEHIDHEVAFKRVRIRLDRELGPFQKRDRIFTKLKAYRRAKELLVERERQTKLEQMAPDDMATQVFDRKLAMVEPYWVFPKKHKQRPKVSAHDCQDRHRGEQLRPKVKILRIKGGPLFAIGTDALANDFLRSNWANKDDLWFHLDGYPGPHLVFKKPDQTNMDEQLLQVFASALRDYAKLAIEEVPILFTRVKNLRGVKGYRGKITYKGEKYMKIVYDKNWRNKVEWES